MSEPGTTSNWEVAFFLGLYMLITALVSFLGPWLAVTFALLWWFGLAVVFLIRDPQ